MPDYKSKCPRTFQEEIDSSCERNDDPLLSPLFTPQGYLFLTLPNILTLMSWKNKKTYSCIFLHMLYKNGG